MADKNLEFGVIGLGRMGANLSLQALEKGIKVVGYDIKKNPTQLRQAGMEEITDPSEFRKKLSSPRAIFLYIPAGPIVDQTIDKLLSTLEKDDIIVDGGNSYWGDSIRRHEKVSQKGFHFVDLGTSGGVDGARHGACFMAGGDDEPVSHIEPILIKLAVPGGYIHAGPPGAGHFVKLVHNGIEFGMLQAIGEGVGLLENYQNKLNIADVLRCWRNGSVIRGWLIDLMEEAYRDEKSMENIPPYVEDTGEANWLVNDALHMEVPIPVISQSIMELFTSRDSKKYWARAIAMMRHGFGGHPFGASQPVAKERQEGQVGGYLRPSKASKTKERFGVR
jgi:6-phosphogluconate dehydrogenase